MTDAPLRFGLMVVLGLLALNQLRQATSRWQWKLRLLTLEFGHWLSLLCLTLATILWGDWLSFSALVFFGVFFLTPAFQASSIASREKLPFSWLGLFCPPNLGRHVRVTRCRIDSGHDAVIYQPPGPEKRRRCVIALHAGGWDSGDPGEFPSANREIAARCDVVIVSVGYHLAPDHVWPTQAEDTRAGITWVKAHADELGIDPDDLVLLGRSAGAQIAAACAFGMPELGVNRCVAVYGPPDMFFARKWSYPDDILESLKLVRQYMGGDPEERPDAYRSASATEFISAQSPAVLLIHGARDSLVWVEHSRRMHAKVQAVAQSHYLELPWGDHGCDYFPGSPGGQLALAMMERFLGVTAQSSQ